MKVSVKKILYYTWFALIFWEYTSVVCVLQKNGNIRLFLGWEGWGLEEAAGVCFFPYRRKKKRKKERKKEKERLLKGWESSNVKWQQTKQKKMAGLEKLFICTASVFSHYSSFFMILQYYVFINSWHILEETFPSTSPLPVMPNYLFENT